MPTKNITFQQSAIFYHTIGKGKPVILIHGFGEDSSVWQQQAQALQDHYQLIMPDLPGSGQSAYIGNSNIESYAGIIQLILETEKITSCAMFGHSMGGYITLALAEKYPQLLQCFGLVHSSAFADNEEKIQARKKSIEFVRSNGAYSFLKTSIPGLFRDEEESTAAINELLEKAKSFTNEAIIQYYEAMIQRPDRTHILRSFVKPILFIIGEFDKAIPLQSSLDQCHLPIKSHVHILKQSGHMGMLEETLRVNEILSEFLQLTY